MNSQCHLAAKQFSGPICSKPFQLQAAIGQQISACFDLYLIQACQWPLARPLSVLACIAFLLASSCRQYRATFMTCVQGGRAIFKSKFFKSSKSQYYRDPCSTFLALSLCFAKRLFKHQQDSIRALQGRVCRHHKG